MDAEFEFAQHRTGERHACRSAVLPRMFAGAACAAAFVIAFSGCSNGGTKQVQRETQLVSLEAANSPGSSPWMDSTTSPGLPRRLNRVENTSTADTSTVSGDQVGLYGGSTNEAVCDRDKLVDFLDRNPKQAAAWRTAAHVSDIRGFASTLSPVVLLRDTRVTNHGFQDGGPTTFQSVLQTGTAVLVDNRGVPRVRCDSGSPLDEAQGDKTEEFTGTRWQDLKSDEVVKVRRSDTPIGSLKVVSMPVVASSDQPMPTTETDTSPPTTMPGSGSTEYLRPPTEFSDMPLGQELAIPDPALLLPPSARVVPVDVAPLLNTVSSSTRTTSSETTTVPSTTSTGTTSSTTTTLPSTTTDITTPTGSDSPTVPEPSPSDSIPATTEVVEPDGVPTEVEPPPTTTPYP
jgi:hypothetical protein